VLKVGKKLAFTNVDITNKEDGQLIATGRHTKALVRFSIFLSFALLMQFWFLDSLTGI